MLHLPLCRREISKDISYEDEDDDDDEETYTKLSPRKKMKISNDDGKDSRSLLYLVVKNNVKKHITDDLSCCNFVLGNVRCTGIIC